MVTRPFSSVIGMSPIGGFKKGFFLFLGPTLAREKFWSPLIDNPYSFNPCSPEGFSQTYFPKGGVVATPLWIINTEGHITLNLLPVYRYGHPFSIDTKISTNH